MWRDRQQNFRFLFLLYRLIRMNQPLQMPVQIITDDFQDALQISFDRDDQAQIKLTVFQDIDAFRVDVAAQWMHDAFQLFLLLLRQCRRRAQVLTVVRIDRTEDLIEQHARPSFSLRRCHTMYMRESAVRDTAMDMVSGTAQDNALFLIDADHLIILARDRDELSRQIHLTDLAEQIGT